MYFNEAKERYSVKTKVNMNVYKHDTIEATPSTDRKDHYEDL